MLTANLTGSYTATHLSFPTLCIDTFWEGLSLQTSVQHLDLRACVCQDLTPLEPLSQLTHLDLRKVRISSRAAQRTALQLLFGFSQLRHLQLNRLAVTDATPLASLTLLTYLNLRSAPLRDLSPLGSLTDLQLLDLHAAPAGDLTPLGQLRQLRHLDLSHSEAQRLEPIARLTCLHQLLLPCAKVTSVAPLSGLLRLLLLDMSQARHAKRDWEQLVTCRSLRKLCVSGYAQAGVQRLQRAVAAAAAAGGAEPLPTAAAALVAGKEATDTAAGAAPLHGTAAVAIRERGATAAGGAVGRKLIVVYDQGELRLMGEHQLLQLKSVVSAPGAPCWGNAGRDVWCQ